MRVGEVRAQERERKTNMAKCKQLMNLGKGNMIFIVLFFFNCFCRFEIFQNARKFGGKVET